MEGKMQQIERERGKPIKDLLVEAFEEHRTQNGVARSLGISQGTLSYWLLKLNLEQKTILVERRS